MRCPKCGYISFDHVETCLKCNKDISGSTEAEGTTYQEAAPSFLKVSVGYDSVDESDSSSEIEFAGAEEGFEFSDPDLDVLVEGGEGLEFEDSDETEELIAFEEADLEDTGSDFQLEADDESDDEDSFDFNLEDDGEELAAPPSLNVPDELSDISDLAPPGQEQAGSGDGMSLSLDDEVSMDEDLDLDGLDLDLGLGGDSNATDSDLSLSLDDIDLSVEDDSDIEGLSMDLDLGGLDESPAPKKEKVPGSLDDLSLSLD